MTPLPPTCARPDAALGSLDPAQHIIWIVCPCPRNWQTLMDIRTMIAHAGGPDVRLCDLPRRMRCQGCMLKIPPSIGAATPPEISTWTRAMGGTCPWTGLRDPRPTPKHRGWGEFHARVNIP